jgi:hypothetical protein
MVEELEEPAAGAWDCWLVGVLKLIKGGEW